MPDYETTSYLEKYDDGTLVAVEVDVEVSGADAQNGTHTVRWTTNPHGTIVLHRSEMPSECVEQMEDSKAIWGAVGFARGTITDRRESNAGE